MFSSNVVGEIVTSLFELPVTSFLTAFRFRYYFKTGSVAATQPVTMILTKGSTPGGALVFTKTMPASQWPASAEVVVELDGALSLSEGAPLLLTIQSASNFSLIGDLANNVAYVLDVSDPTTPVLISTALPIGQNPVSISTVGRYGCITDNTDDNLQVVDFGGISAQNLNVGPSAPCTSRTTRTLRSSRRSVLGRTSTWERHSRPATSPPGR